MNKEGQIRIVESLAKLSDCFEVANQDALDFLAPRIASAGHFVYLDPPYYVKGKKLYKNFYRHEDHEAIARLLEANRDGQWVVSYDNVPQIRELYGSFDATIYSLHYSAGPSATGEEVMYASDAVQLPAFPGFAAAA